MSRKVFVDFHHSSLLRSLVLLFEKRLGMEVFRPIGMEWYNEGFWAINDQLDTAKQFLDLEQALPPDGTAPLNINRPGMDAGTYVCADPGGKSFHRACTLEYFKNNQFDYVIASIPQHVPLFKELIAKYQPKAKLIIQMGNNWDLAQYQNHNVLASLKAPAPAGVNVMFYHQEFDLGIFYPGQCKPTKQIYSFVNVIQNSGQGWTDYSELKKILERQGYSFKAYGGQCPDGNMTGPHQMADKMREAMMVFHVKPGGDGFGHVIHNAYSVGRPVITRSSHYKGQLAEDLLVPGTFIDLDKYEGYGEVKNMLTKLQYMPDQLAEMGRKAARRFAEVVNYTQEAKEVWQWLENLS